MYFTAINLLEVLKLLVIADYIIQYLSHVAINGQSVKSDL